MGFIVSLILWLLFGALAGWLASKLTGTDDRINGIANIIVGIAGAVVGGFLVSLIGDSGLSGFSIYSLIIAVIGASLLLMVYKSLQRTS